MNKFKFVILILIPLLNTACAHNPSKKKGKMLVYNDKKVVLEAGHPSLQEWLLPDIAPSPKNNKVTQGRAHLGEKLFFDPRINSTGQNMVSCVSCHLPERGWADGQPVALLLNGGKLDRASPMITNSGFNTIQMWDGALKQLEDQIVFDLNFAPERPHIGIEKIKNLQGYRDLFDINYPGEGININTIAKAIASFERTVVSNHSPFDQWVKGDASAMSAQQITGFSLFLDSKKGNCAVCHDAPNFSDSGFHNIGLASYGETKHDVGRYKHKPLKIMDGAFKTPTLRDVDLSPPYFHDGSAATLADVMTHYSDGGQVKTNLSPNFKANKLSDEEQQSIIAFMQALTTVTPIYRYPVLPEK